MEGFPGAAHSRRGGGGQEADVHDGTGGPGVHALP